MILDRFRLDGKVAVVTGGGLGIGRGVAVGLAEAGADVVVGARTSADLDEVVGLIEATGRRGLAVVTDVMQVADRERLIAAAVAAFGRLDILVNNAGTAIPKAFEETTLEEMDRVIDINLRGVLIATRAALRHLKDAGRIINIGSCVGERMMTPGLVTYAATKGAVKMFTQGLSREVGARGITVNTIQPGPIDTDLNPASGDWATPQIANTALKRYGHADDIAAMVAFVAGPEASYITGASLTVDGGTNA